MYMRVCVCMCGVLSVGAHQSQKRTSDPLELELQLVVNHPTWVLEVKPQSSTRTGEMHINHNRDACKSSDLLKSEMSLDSKTMKEKQIFPL